MTDLQHGDRVFYTLPEKPNERGITGVFIGIRTVGEYAGLAICDFPGESDWRFVDPKRLERI